VQLNDRVRKNVSGLVHASMAQDYLKTHMRWEKVQRSFSISVSTLILSDLEIKIDVSAAYKGINNYPDNRYPDFKKAAADYLHVSPRT